jgi:hypothetical protein
LGEVMWLLKGLGDRPVSDVKVPLGVEPVGGVLVQAGKAAAVDGISPVILCAVRIGQPGSAASMSGEHERDLVVGKPAAPRSVQELRPVAIDVCQAQPQPD